jgi:hypothetical protein
MVNFISDGNLGVFSRAGLNTNGANFTNVFLKFAAHRTLVFAHTALAFGASVREIRVEDRHLIFNHYPVRPRDSILH